MSRSPNSSLLLALVVCIMVVAGTLIGAVLLVGRRPVVVVVPSPVPAAPAAAAAPAVATSLPIGTTTASPPMQPTEIVAVRVPAAPPVTDVFHSAWEQTPSSDIPLQAQQVAMPMLDHGTITSVRVQALHDGKRIAWRLSWRADRPATGTETSVFPDGAAIQFPMADGAPFTMGAKDMPVRVIQWKALWQKDIDQGFQDIQSIYPNAWSDLYWFSTEGAGNATIQSLANPEADQFMPAHAAGNPMADFDRAQPVDEIVAEGFGTTTSVSQSPSSARGVWRDGQWTVVVDRPWDPQDPLIARLAATRQAGQMALAVWDGSAQNSGGRKHYCTWIPLTIEP